MLYISRSEVGGTLNVVPINVVVDGKVVGRLTGESMAEVPLPGGVHSVVLEYYNPYKDRESLRRLATNITFTSKSVTLLVTPVSMEESSYSGEWSIQGK